jgi:hypothetical protein
MKRLFFLLILTMISFASSALLKAQTPSAVLLGNPTPNIPQTLSYQGILTDASGNPVPDGAYAITFSFYNVATGGTALFTRGPISVTTSKGLFATILGTGITNNNAPLPFELGDAQHWIGIKVGSNAELAPRVQLTSVPYAFTAGRLSLPYFDSTDASIGVEIRSTTTSFSGAAIRGTSTSSGSGVRGQALNNGYGVLGVSQRGYGVFGESISPSLFAGGGFSHVSGGLALRTFGGSVVFDTLAGAGTRMVVASPSGFLSTQPIPNGVTLPFTASGTATAGNTLFSITNIDASGANSTAIYGRAQGASAGLQSAAVRGDHASASGNGIGVYGTSSSSTGFGVYGSSASIGVAGATTSQFGAPAIRASFEGTGAGNALEVRNGAIVVSGTNPTAFVVNNSANNTAITINNPLCNGDPQAILIVTANTSAGPTANFTAPFSVFYSTATSRWVITRMDGVALPQAAAFNVLVIKR